MKNERQNPKQWILPWLEDALVKFVLLLLQYYIKEASIQNNTVYDKMEAFCAKNFDLTKARFYRK